MTTGQEIAAPRHAEGGPNMDDAQRSAAEALRILFRIVVAAMVAIAGLFLASGFQSVQEGERGVRLTFGKVDQTDVGPGYTWVWPFPVGELRTVSMGARRLRVQDAFWSESTMGLKPGEGGGLLTGDGGIVHAKLEVQYSVTDQDAGLYLRNVRDAGAAVDLVRAAVRSAAVRVVAGVKADDFLRGTDAAGGAASIERRITQAARRALQSAGAGITVQSVSLIERAVPGPIKEAYGQADAAEQRADKAIAEAKANAEATMLAAAGPAAGALLDAIGAYEEAVALAGAGDQDAEPEAALEGVYAVLQQKNEQAVSGAAASILRAAEADTQRIVSAARRAAEEFQGALPAYRQSRDVYMVRRWTEAYGDFLAKNTPEVFAIPKNGGAPAVQLGRNPDIQNDLVRERNARQAAAGLEESRENARRARQRKNGQR